MIDPDSDMLRMVDHQFTVKNGFGDKDIVWLCSLAIYRSINGVNNTSDTPQVDAEGIWIGVLNGRYGTVHD